MREKGDGLGFQKLALTLQGQLHGSGLGSHCASSGVVSVALRISRWQAGLTQWPPSIPHQAHQGGKKWKGGYAQR